MHVRESKHLEVVARKTPNSSNISVEDPLTVYPGDRLCCQYQIQVAAGHTDWYRATVTVLTPAKPPMARE